MFFLLLILWVVAEVFVIVRVADAIGPLLTIVLLIAAWPLGTWAMRSEGRAVWRRFNAALAEGRPPGREVVDGALVVLGGGLLIIPGFITDFLGLLLLLPPTRALLRPALVRSFQNRMVLRFTTPPGGGERVEAEPYDVEGTAREVDSPQIRP